MRKLLISGAFFLLQAVAASAQDGLVLNQQYVNGLGGGNQSYLIATLMPNSSAGAYDHLHLVATFNCNDFAGCNSTIDATFGNRGGFMGVYSVMGAYPSGYAHLAAYTQSDGTTNIWLMLANYYDVASYTVLENVQETVYTSPTNIGAATPPGTLVFDTANPAYPPANYTDFAGDFFPAGNVGIGTTAPLTSLQVNGTIYSALASNSIGFATWPGNNTIYNFMGAAGEWGIRTDTSYGINFDVNDPGGPSLTPLHISQNGNVGIGAITPAATLEVNGNIKVDGSLVFPGGAQTLPYPGPPTLTTILGSGNTIPSPDLPSDVDYIDQAQTIAGQKSFMSSVGIGTTTPGALLDLTATSFPAAVLNLTHSGAGNYGFTLGSEAVSNIYFGVSGSTLQYFWRENWNTPGIATNTFQTPPDSLNLAASTVNVQGIPGQTGSLLSLTSSGGSIGNLLTALPNGNVGVGTTTPGADLTSLASPPSASTPILEVKGDIALAQGSGGSIYFSDGTVQSTAYVGTTCPTGGDYAESVNIVGAKSDYGPGDVMVIGTENTSDVTKSTEPYSTLVAGIYSTKPGFVGRRQTTDPKTSKTEIPMAMVGIVPTKVSAENGPIHRGDLLVTASIAGYAMKGTDRNRMVGAVVGKAMGSLESGTGMIEVLVSLQ